MKLKPLLRCLLLLVVVAGFSSGCSAPPENLIRQVQLLDHAVYPATTPDGVPAWDVYARWRNNGPKPIGMLYGTVNAYDASGMQIGTGTGSTDEILFAHEPTEGTHLIQPGEAVFRPGTPDGFRIVALRQVPARFEVVLTRAYSRNLLDND